MDQHQRRSVSDFDINSVIREEEGRENEEGSMVAGVGVGIGTVSVRNRIKLTLTSLMTHGDQMVGQASVLNFYSVFPRPLLISMSYQVLVFPPSREDLDFCNSFL